MAYDEALAGRCRRVLDGEAGLAERRMFGGLAFLLHGKMICGVLGPKLVIRMDPGEPYEAALKRPHVLPMDFTGRPMRGYVYVLPGGTTRNVNLKNWVEGAVVFGRTLPRGPKGHRGPRARGRPQS